MKRRILVILIAICLLCGFWFMSFRRVELLCLLPDKRIKLTATESLDVINKYKKTEFILSGTEPRIGFIPMFTFYINDENNHYIKGYEPVIPDVQIDSTQYYYEIDPCAELLDVLRKYEMKYFPEEYRHMADTYYTLIEYEQPMMLKGKNSEGSNVYAVTGNYPIDKVYEVLKMNSADERTVDEVFNSMRSMNNLNTEIAVDGIKIKLTGISSFGNFYYFYAQ